MFSPYAFYFRCFLYFLLSRDCSFIHLGFSPCPQHFLQISKKKKQMEKKFCSFSWHAVFLWFMKLVSSAFATVFMQHFVRNI